MSLLFDYEHLMCENKPNHVSVVKNINYFPHSHSGIEIIYILSGDTIVTSEDESYNLRKGDIAIFMPGQIHAFKSVNDNEALIVSANSRSIMENVMMDVMYEIPSDDTIRECKITKEAVEGNGEPVVIRY